MPDVRPRPINVLVLQGSPAQGQLPVASTSARRSTPSAALGPRAASSSAFRGIGPAGDLVSFLRPRRTRHPVPQASPSPSLPLLAHSFSSIGHSCPPFEGSAPWPSSPAPQGSSLRHLGAFGFWQLPFPASHLTFHVFTCAHEPKTRWAERRLPPASTSLLASLHTHRGLTPACSGLAALATDAVG